MRTTTTSGFLLAILATSVTAFADGDAALGTSYQEVHRGGGIVVTGLGTAGRTGGQGPQTSASLTYTLPAGATPAAAFFYVNTIGTVANASLNIDVDGTAVSAPLIGTHGPTCWGTENINRAYRASVGDLIPASGTTVISGFPSTASAADDTQGVALVIVYEDNTSGDATVVTINDGMIATSGAADHNSTINNLSITGATTAARLVTVVGDGQNPGAILAFNSATVSNNAFPGALGPMFDVRDDDVFGMLNVPVTLGAVDIDASSDCLSWMVNALTYTFPDNDADGIDDDADDDDDNDGVVDTADPDPLNPDICGDDDADMCDDCVVGTDDFGPLDDFDPSNDGTDSDGDGLCDDGDPDADNDGVNGDAGDPDDFDPDTCGDSDSDTCDDCAVGTDDFGPLPDNDPNDDGPDSDGDGICDDGEMMGTGGAGVGGSGSGTGGNTGAGGGNSSSGIGGGNGNDDDGNFIEDAGGCGCRVPASPGKPSNAWWLLGALALARLRRRR